MNSPLPASTRASHASANTAGKPARNAPAFPPMSSTPVAATAAQASAIHSAFERFGQANTFAGVAAAWPRISAARVPATVLRQALLSNDRKAIEAAAGQ